VTRRAGGTGRPQRGPLAPDAYAAALAHHRAGRLDEAAAGYRRSLAMRPNLPEAHYNLGLVLARLGRIDEAIVCQRRALALHPALAEAHVELARAHAAQGALATAADCYRKALALKPDDPVAHNNLGNALKALNRLEDAIACYARAIALQPDLPALHANFGNTLKAMGRADEAVAAYRRALSLKPDYAEVHHSLAVLLLAQGDMAAGWEEFEWRWQAPQMARSRRDFTAPLWRGEAGDGGTLLIHAEQGFGDTLQFCRYAPLAAARGWRVVLEVQPPLVRLLAGLPGVAQIVGRGEALPPFDRQCPMLSLPLAMGTTLQTVPAATSYLQADPARTAALAARLAPLCGAHRRIGLAWAGNPRRDLSPVESANAQRRSLDPALLASLFDIPGLRFVSLQKAGPPAPPEMPMIDVMAEMEDFADTAALIAALDLVISVDTSVAHLAGALGRPVWVMTRRDHCWRWLEGRTDSPWYPALRIYRQSVQDDWTGVVAAVAADLRALEDHEAGTATGDHRHAGRGCRSNEMQ
jgi:tetratricopeptide (TPR) repeat protein